MMSCALALLLILMSAESAPALPDSAIFGRVEDGSGTPLHEVSVELFRPGDSRPLARTRTDHDGKFLFSGVSAGDFQLVARMAGFETMSRLVTAADFDRNLVLILVASVPRVATDISVFGAVPRTAASSSILLKDALTKQVIVDPGDVLRIVPGLTVVQHAGGGKANQFLIRGFDADHGTDFAISFDGIPVNMVSHAHGQGYADMNFIIPETLEGIDVYKGPYFAELGNFVTAGAALLRLRSQFERSFVKVEGGQFNSGRVLFGFSPRTDRTRGFLAVEGRYADGPFQHPQAFRRVNIATRWTVDLPSHQSVSVLGTGYAGKWNQSGQIPLREVQAGRLDRFGSVDPSEGGESSRYNFSISHQKLWSRHSLDSQFYAVYYDMDLFSNFTFYLADPVRGDGIKQADRRQLFGSHVQHHYHYQIGSMPLRMTTGLDFRQDFADVALHRQQQRRIFDTILLSNINERNVGLYAQGELEVRPELTAILGVRHDRFRFDVKDEQRPHAVEYRDITGPKASLIYSPWRARGPVFYLNYGRGFHSNDARSVVFEPTAIALAPAGGYEIGYRQLIGSALEVTVAYWLLDLAGELVFVGDEGTTELQGPTRRHGPELEVKWRMTDYLWLDFEGNHSSGHFRRTKDLIPRAPRLTAGGGLSFDHPAGFSGKLRLRHVDSHPLVEDSSVQAEPYTAADLYLQYSFAERWKAILTVENLFNSKISEAQTFFESRLPGEPAPLGDNHFSPANPFTAQLGIEFIF